MGFSKHVIRNLVWAVCCGGLVTAAGCSSGGGGGGSTPVSQAAISSSNAGRIGKDAYDAQAGLGGAGDFAGDSAGIKSAAGQTIAARSLAGLALDAIRLGAARASGIRSPNQSQTIPCDNQGGSLTFTLTNVGDPNALDAGDSISVTFTNCVDNLENITTSGSFSITIGAATGDVNNDALPWSFSVTVTYTNLTITAPEGTLTSNGSLTLGTSWSGSSGSPPNQLTLTMSGNSLTLASGSETVQLTGSFTFSLTGDINGDDFSITYTMTVVVPGVGSVTVTTPMALTGTLEGTIEDGQILITGDGSTLTLDFSAGGVVTVTLDSDADGNPDCIQNLTVDTLDSFDAAAC